MVVAVSRDFRNETKIGVDEIKEARVNESGGEIRDR